MKEKTEEYYKDFDFSYCRHYILTHHYNDYLAIKESVKKMMEGIFIFDDNWDMEPCLTPHRLYPFRWDTVPEDDPEWAYMLNRQTYFIKFLICYLIEEDPVYTNFLKEKMSHWIETVTEFSLQSVTTRTLDTGIRCFTWLRVMLFLSYFDLLDEAEFKMISHSIEQQLKYLKEQYLDKYSLSNWGIFQTVAIIACYSFLKDEILIEEEYQFAREELKNQLHLQILEDGTQFEQSTLYHVEVYKALAELSIFVPELKAELLPYLKKMAFYLQMMTGPDGHQIALGDSDCNDTGDVLTLSSILLENTEFSTFSRDTVDIFTVLLVGRPGIQFFHSLKKEKLAQESYFFKDSGHICIRDRGSYLFFKNGPIGSSHTHSDENSFCLYHEGKPIFIDAGRYTYKEDPLRYQLKGAAYHNTCILDGIPPEQISGSWSYEAYPQPINCDYQKQGDAHYLEGSYLAFNQESFSYLHGRKIVMLAGCIWLLVDDIVCQGEHELSTQFILDDQVSYKGTHVNNLRIYSESDLESDSIVISKRYNELLETKRLTKKTNFSNRLVDYTLLVDKQIEVKEHAVYQTGSRQTLKHAKAFEFIGKGLNYLLVMIPEEIYKGEKLCLVDGVKFRGKCIVYDKNTQEIQRLKN